MTLGLGTCMKVLSTKSKLISKVNIEVDKGSAIYDFDQDSAYRYFEVDKSDSITY